LKRKRERERIILEKKNLRTEIFARSRAIIIISTTRGTYTLPILTTAAAAAHSFTPVGSRAAEVEIVAELDRDEGVAERPYTTVIDTISDSEFFAHFFSYLSVLYMIGVNDLLD